ncbi:MAG: GntR family transcriptional regulator [Mogibacterium sp.]|nr:GntR family transcriptional regulator [Mogibacterium sp.]
MFQLDMKSGKSVYEQIMDSIKELIVTGVLPEGSRLPSVRELSRQLTINPNTVQKAFRALESDGYIYTVTGKGSFVSARDDIRVDDARVREAVARTGEAFKGLLYLGIPAHEARALALQEIDSIIDNNTGRSL